MEVASVAATGVVSTVVALGEISAGESEAEEEIEDEKLSFFFKKREKEKEELMVRLKLKALPWLVSVWQKARH